MDNELEARLAHARKNMLPTPVMLADGKERHLRYSLGARKRVQDKWGKDFQEILNKPVEDMLPNVIMEGLVEKEGITETTLRDELIIGPMIDDITTSFVESFFGERQGRLVRAVNSQRDEIIARLERGEKAIPLVPETPTPSTVQ